VRDLAMRPRGVHAPAYTEWRVEVLGRSEEILARPETPGPLVDVAPLRAVAERVLAEGKPAPAVD